MHGPEHVPLVPRPSTDTLCGTKLSRLFNVIVTVPDEAYSAAGANCRLCAVRLTDPPPPDEGAVVAVGGAGADVAVGGTGVAVGGSGVAVGGSGVAVGVSVGTGVSVGAVVAVGGTGVAVAAAIVTCAVGDFVGVVSTLVLEGLAVAVPGVSLALGLSEPPPQAAVNPSPATRNTITRNFTVRRSAL